MGYVVTIGAMFYDYIATRESTGSNLRSACEPEFGGSLFNITANLKAFNVDCVFVTAFNDGSSYTLMSETQLRKLGIRYKAFYTSDIGDNFYLRINKGLELAEAKITDFDMHDFDVEPLAEIIKGASVVCFSAELSVTSINRIIDECRKNNVFSVFCGLSEYECTKILECTASPDIFIINKSEADTLCEQLINYPDYFKLSKVLGGTNLIITQGKFGAVYVDPRSAIPNYIRTVEEPITGTSIGAGDLFVAGFIFHISQHENKHSPLSIVESIRKAQPEVKQILSLKHGNLLSSGSVATTLDYVQQSSEKDPLTGLLNRNGLERALNAMHRNVLKYNTSCLEMRFLLIFDLDKFKSINDSFGHPTGDKVLTAFANCIKNNVRDDDIFARYGGEEFILITISNPQNLIAQLTRILRQVSNISITKPEGHDGLLTNITTSIGGTHFPSNKNLSTAITEADKLLYKCKDRGRKQFIICLPDGSLHHSHP